MSHTYDSTLKSAPIYGHYDLTVNLAAKIIETK